jgi:hypothetical protein
MGPYIRGQKRRSNMSRDGYLVTYRGGYYVDYAGVSVTGSGAWQRPESQVVEANQVVVEENSYFFYSYGDDPVAVIPVDQVQSIVQRNNLMGDDGEENTDS